MKRWVNHALVWAVILTMTVSIAGCGGAGSSKETTTPVVAKETVGETVSPTAKAAEPVTLTVFGGETGKTFSPGIQTDPVAKKIEQQLAITMNVIDQATTPDKIKVLIASGDLPDVFQVPSDQMQTLIDNKTVLDLSGLIESNGPDIKKNAAAAVEFSKKYLSNGTGKVYFLPSQIDPDGKLFQLIAPYIRWDYYKELGYPPIKNNDDLLNVVAEMLKKHPTNEAGQKFYGFSPWFDWDIWPFNVFTGLTTGRWNVSPAAEWDPFNLKFSSWLYNDKSFIWDAVSFWNKAYRMGLLDPDALTQKYDQALQKGAQNRILAEIAEWHRGSTNQELAKAGFKDRGIEPLPPYEGTEYYVGTQVNMVGQKNRSWAISSKTKNPERAMELLNYFFSLEGSLTINSGAEGDSWVLKDGKYQLTDKFNDAMKNDPNYALTTGAFKYNTWSGLGENFKLPTGQRMKLIADEEIEKITYTDLDKEWLAYYGVETKGEVIPKFAKNYAVNDIASLLLTPQPPDDINRDSQKIAAYIIKTLPTMVLAKSDEQLAQMKKKLQDDVKKMGYDKVYAWTENDYNKAITSVKEFMASIKK